ncbi:hypothetical protein SFB4_069G2, partial [Candidatus Arthromitus sp. SFB-4]
SLPFLYDKNNFGEFVGLVILFVSILKTISVNLSDVFTKIKLVKNWNKFDLSLAKPTFNNRII